LQPLVPRDSYTATFLIGWATTLTAGYLTYPFSTLRKRLMVRDEYTSTLRLVAEIFKSEGIKGFYGGALFQIMRSIGGAFILALYDQRRDISPLNSSQFSHTQVFFFFSSSSFMQCKCNCGPRKSSSSERKEEEEEGK
jgi:hypothetical protein